jgi:large subunit ribosomal protein L54
MTKKERRKYERKHEKLLKATPKRIPLHEQSKDLTGPQDDAVVSLERRQEVTKSARVARRKGIRESNFLRTM